MVCHWQNLCLVCLIPFFPIYLFLRVEYLCCIMCVLCINTPASGLAKVRQLQPIFLLLFCVLQRPTLASLLCRNHFSELLFSRLVFNFKSSLHRRPSSCFCYLHLLLSSFLPLPSPPPPSHFHHHLLHQHHRHLPCFCHRSSTPPLIFTITSACCVATTLSCQPLKTLVRVGVNTPTSTLLPFSSSVHSR